ncbi:reverse transcriptase domain-containing protein [Tanacetum coccineum]
MEDTMEADIAKTTMAGVMNATIQTGTLPSNTQPNQKQPFGSNDKPYRPPPTRIEHVNVVFIRNAKTYDPPPNPNDKITIIHDDSDDEAKDKYEEDNLTPFAPKQTEPSLMENKLEEISTAFLNEECSAIIRNKIPLKLRDPRSFLILCTLGNSITCDACIDLSASINLMPYSLYAKLLGGTLKPPGYFVILEMEDDSKVPLILGRPFLHTANAIICVKSKELNLGVVNKRITFMINKAMQHSHSNDDTCFNIDVIDEVTEEELDALLQDSNPFMSTSKKINETDLYIEFAEFIEVKFKEYLKDEEEADEDFEELTLEEKLRIKKYIQDPPTNIEKSSSAHLEYAYLEMNYLLPVILSSRLKANEKERLVSVLKNHKEAFAWRTSDIPGISPNFCKHKDAIFAFNEECIKAFEMLKEKLTNTPIIVSPDWSMPFELMCDVSDFAIVIEIKNKKGAKNVAAAHLSRLKNPNLDELREDEVHDNFPGETLLRIGNNDEEIPWFADFANYLTENILRKGLTYAQRCKFFLELKHCFSEEPYLFKMCLDEMKEDVFMVLKLKRFSTNVIMAQLGHYSPSTTAKKVFDAGFYWPTIFAHTLVQNCDVCRRSVSLSRRDEMPQNNI